ncbi:hypothetical protein A1351_22430 [Methylosinus sp. R-45379]|uniref:radical SAM/SPASM domain-containing protein n=1 Tax=Methylosinus sp. R-45379 TaxID=980563 RepID=UPI0007C8B0C7|nr:radical SAM/SPASM domain-containing protein [Methylosinus sp. R-45379]OAI30631.1 hypothetical protein A1351_22430 [Methylosinus sp. R-45379]
MVFITVTPEEIVATARAELFTKVASLETAKELFKRTVSQVEIEIFSYCNRTCWFCPNSLVDRRSSNQFMHEDLYLRIVNDLADIAYDRVVTYSRYNEPLSDRIILKRLRQARIRLPNAHLTTFTNGDYLTREYLEELRDSGLNSINIMTYLGNTARYSDVEMLTAMTNKVKQLGLPCEFSEAKEGVGYAAELRYPGMRVKLLSRNFERTGVDRGGQVPIGSYRRESWCPVVFKHFYVDWNGCVVPCCNIRSDIREHEAHVVADLNDGRTIFEAYAASALVDWRRSLFNYETKKAPCSSCSHSVPQDTPEMRALIAQIGNDFIT